MSLTLVIRSPRLHLVPGTDRLQLTVAQAGPQGPAGPAGPPGAPGGVALVREAAEAVSALRVVRSDSAGNLVLARWPEVESTAVLGIATNAASSGADVSVQHSGEIEDSSWTWTPGAPVFLGVNGTLTQVVPTTDFLLVMGEAVSATRLVVRIQAPVFLAS